MNSRLLMPFLAIFTMLLAGCSKFDLKWFHHHSPDHCTVQQFNSGFMNPAVSPYLFRKTYDASGVVNAMDAYLLGVFIGERRFNFKIKRSGFNVYFIDVTSGDSLMRTTLNIFGRPVSAEELPDFYQGQPEPFDPMRYEFHYTSNRLTKLTTIRTTFTTHDTCVYDGFGNLLRMQHPTALGPEGDVYAYDYTKTAKQQFYMDIEMYSSFLPGFRLLEYLDAFPELTSPKHFRINHTNIEFSTGFPLYDHVLDAKKKLIAYKGGVTTRQFTIIWKCKK